MKRMMRITLIALVCWLTAGIAGTQPAGGIDVKVVKFDGLADEILKHRGKVVVVDFWATTCIPCMQAFPKVVDFVKANEKDGLVLLTVSTNKLTDDEGKSIEADVKARCLKFLQSKSSPGVNLILDESEQAIIERLRIQTIPCLYVFGRDGRWTQFSAENKNLKKDDAGHYVEMEALVKDLLKKSP